MKKIAMCLFAISTGCAADGLSDGTSGDGASGDGTRIPQSPRLEMRLTDAPGDYDNVWVNIASVAIESADLGWMTITEQPQKFDLLTLQNDVTAALGGATLEAGTYGQLRLVVDSASVVVGGVESPLTIASGAQTGIKINLDSAFEDNMTYAVTLDFDADKSVKSVGKGYLMTPVVHVKEVVAKAVEPTDETPTDEMPSEEPTDETIF